MRADFCHWMHTPFFRTVARLLIFVLLFQNVPADVLRPAHADTAEGLLFVDALGACGGETPCFTTIQEAIDAATAGTTVRVLSGEYEEQLRIRNKNLGPAASESDRITIEADPAAPVGSVLLTGPRDRCASGYAVAFARARYVTLRGFTIMGAGRRGIVLRGGSRASTGVRFERNRVLTGTAFQCQGGIDLQRGNPDTVIAHNLVYGVAKHALRIRNFGSAAYVVGNTIVRNGWNGLYLERAGTARVWNNILAFNGTAPGGKGGGKFGVRRKKATKPVPAEVDLAHNVICGNRGGEIDGPALDAGDRANLTPTGSEGAGVVASAGCEVIAHVFHDAAGADRLFDSADDDFTLAVGSPAIDRGLDPRTEGTTIPDALFEADYAAADARPRGEGFDVGALELGAATQPTPVATATASPTSTTTAAVTPSHTPTPTVSRTATPELVTTTPTPAAATPSATPIAVVTATPAGPEPTATALVPFPTASSTTASAPTATVTPGGANHPPVANDDQYELEVATSLQVPAPGVLGNDDDPDQDPLDAKLVDLPLLGSLTAFNADGSFTYEAPPNFVQPSLNPGVLWRIVTGTSAFGQVADFNKDGFPDLAFIEFGQVYGHDGRNGNRIFQVDFSDTTHVDIRGCSIGAAATSSMAVGDVDDSGDVSFVKPLQCPGDSSMSRFAAINGSEITAGKVAPLWATENLSVPHPGAYASPSDPAPASPPIRTQVSATERTQPALARLTPAGGVKVLARKLLRNIDGVYLGLLPNGTVGGRQAGCRSVTGLPADENQPCRITWIIDAATGAVEHVLTAPNPTNSFNLPVDRPLSNNPPFTADLDGDGDVEIISGSDVFTQDNGGWTLAWQTHFEPLTVAVADLDGDGTQEVIQYQPNLFGRQPPDSGIFIYKHDGTLLRRIPPVKDGQLLIGFLSIGDVDGDGAPDILFPAEGFLYAFRADGRLLWIFAIPDRPETLNNLVPAPVSSQFRTGETSAQVYDLDLDGRPEVIMHAAARLWILDGGTGGEKWSMDTEGGGNNRTLALADVDQDGHVDIVATGGQRWNCSVITGGPVPCLGNTLVVSGQDHNWAPGPKVFHQIPFSPATVDDHAKILVATAPRRDFRMAAQQGTVVDPRLRQGTTFTYTAEDATGPSAPATVFVKIRPDNSPPDITSLPPTGFRSIAPYARPVYQLTATDPDPGDVLRYEFVSTTHFLGGKTETPVGGATGVSVDPDTGAVSFYTGPCGSFGGGCNLGDVNVVVAAVDALGLRDEQSFIVTIHSGAATVPDVLGQAQGRAIDTIHAAGLRARIVLETFDAAPVGTVIAQTPAGGTTGVALGTSIDLSISKGPLPTPTPIATASRTPDPNATVTPIPVVDDIVVEPVDQILIPGTTQQYVATAVFADGTAADVTAEATWDSSAAAAATVSATGLATAAAAGTTTISAAFAGKTGGTTLTVAAKVPSDFTDPTAAITSPARGAEVTEPVDVIGTASDDNFLKYELAIAPAGEDAFTTIATGAAPVAGGVLGRLDPTLLINDLYDLKLLVFDRNGNQAEATVGVQIAREQKIGLFTITFQDLNVPVAGIPITVTRTYDSRDKGQGDFGIGWRLGVRSLRVRANREQGTGWEVQKIGGALGSFVLVGADQHKVSLTLPNGKVEEFDLVITPTVSPLVPLETVTASYVARPGTLGTLTALADNDLLVIGNQPGEVELVGFSNADTYDPTLFRYVSGEGTVFDVDRTTGVQKLQDRNGNTLTIGANGIVHSSGKSITFARDGAGRITAITDPLGHAQTYAYDGRGDLIAHTDPVGNTTRFTYDRKHGLLDVVDPTGARAARNEYDADGRLIAIVDGLGHRTEIAHDPNARQEVTTDRLGNVTVYEYDTVGNVVAKTDALGKRTTYTHDARGNVLTETDPLGRVAASTWDAADNQLTHTDFEGNLTTWTYNARRQALTETNAVGETTTNVFDANGNLTSTTDDGGIATFTYDAAGNRLTATDALGRTTTSTYDTTGNVLTRRDPLNHVTTFTYDAAGRVRTETDPLGRTTETTYDARGRVLTTKDAKGGVTQTAYDEVGNVASTTDALGRVTTFGYDVRGKLTAQVLPDGSTQVTAYDAEGREVSRTDGEGHTTTYVLDPLGRRLRVIHPDGEEVVTTYDAIGRTLTVEDERGNVTTHAYGVRQKTTTDALGHATVETFDGLGRLTRTTDALGRVVQFAFDEHGNQVGTTFPDGTTTTTTFDAANQRTAAIDQAGKTTLFSYDAAGRLQQVTDAEGNVTTYGYDAADNLTAQTDANGRTTTLEYDVLNRLAKRTRPLGQFETFAYDAVGNRTSLADFDGKTTTLDYDEVGRLVATHLPDGSDVTYAYDGRGLRTQAGDDHYAYDDRGRLTTETKAGGAVLGYGYDAAGNRVSFTTPQGTTTYTYDAANRLQTVVDTTGTTTYGYDAVGNLASTALPNGVTTTYTNDTLNRVTNVAHEGPGGPISSYTYTLGPAGNRIQVVEAGAATTGRTVTYTYDDVYRLTEEAIDEPGSANDQTVTYVYDPVGNRTETNRDGTVTTSTYDANDRLASETTNGTTTTSAYDGDGNLVSRTTGGDTDVYAYDDQSRLVGVSPQSGANPQAAVYTYDADGIRTSRTAGGVTTTFLVDKNRDFAQVAVETTGATVTTYTHGHTLLSQTRTGSGSHFHLSDGQLSTRQLTTPAGAVSDTYTYDAFGVALAASGGTANDYRYAGEQLDPNAGFYYLRARHYEAATGRFTSTDPLEGNPFEPVSLHRYLYANADPVDRRDPSGRSSVLAVVGLLSILALVYLGVAFRSGFLGSENVPDVAGASVDLIALYLSTNAWTDVVAIGNEIELIFKAVNVTMDVTARAGNDSTRYDDPAGAGAKHGRGRFVVALLSPDVVGIKLNDAKKHVANGVETPTGGIITGRGTTSSPSEVASHLLGHCFGLADNTVEENVMNSVPGSQLGEAQGKRVRSFLKTPSGGRCK